MPGTPTNQGEQELLAVGLCKGIDGTTAPYLLDPSNLVDATNFLPDQGYGALTTALGRGGLPGIGPIILPGPCNGVALFNRFNPFGATPPVYVFALDYLGAGTIWVIESDGSGTLRQLALPAGVTWATGEQTFFAEAGVWIFISNGNDPPLKINNALQITLWGIDPPVGELTLTGESGGDLSFGEAPYYYCVTFGHTKSGFLDPGQESSQGTISDAFTLAQTPGTGSFTFDTTISSLPANYNFQFMLRIAGADYPVGQPYVTNGSDTAQRAANLIAANINAAGPIAYVPASGITAGTLTVTASVSNFSLATVNISVADSLGDAIDTPGYVQFYVNYEHASPGGPYFVDPNQSDPAAVAGGATNTAIKLTNIPVSLDPQVNERNIYRLGGGLGQWRLVTTLMDNTTTTYLDTTADNKLTGQALVVFRDPPSRFNYICAHQQRIFGFNTLHDPLGTSSARNNSSSLWWSNYAEPWGFNELQNILTVGESLEGDPGIGMASLGTTLGICKKKGFYALYGNSDATWASGLYKVADTGCVSARSICAAYGVMGWVSRQGAYAWQGMMLPTNISDGAMQQSNIKNVFDEASVQNLRATVGFWYGRMLGFSFNNPVQRTYMYDSRTNGWWSLPYYLTQVAFDLTTDVPVVGIRGDGTNVNVDAWFLYGTDLKLPIVATGLTRVSGDPDMTWSKDLQHLLVDAPIGSAIFSATIVADPGGKETVWPLIQPIDLSQGFPRHRVSTQQIEYVDVQLSFTLTTSQPGTVINRIALYGALNRQFAPETQSDQ